jgi:hypothetical protein
VPIVQGLVSQGRLGPDAPRARLSLTFAQVGAVPA